MSEVKTLLDLRRHPLSTRLFRHRKIVAALAVLAFSAVNWIVGGLCEQWQMQRLAGEITRSGGAVGLKSSMPHRIMAQWRRQYVNQNSAVTLRGPTFNNRWLLRHDDMRRLQIEDLTIDECPLYASDVCRLLAQHPVEYVAIQGVPGMDVVAQSLTGKEALTAVVVSDSDLSDVGFQRLPLEQLDFLFIQGSCVSPVGLRALERCGRLDYLSLDGRQFDDSVAELLHRKETVTMLELTGDEVTDASLQNLVGMPLVYVSLHDTSATDEGVETLRMAMPKCRVSVWNYKKSPK